MKIDMFVEILLIIIICYITPATPATAKCPSVEVMLPCRCESEENESFIYCGGNEYYNLKNIFVLISSALKDEKHFKRFNFNNTAISELVINVFYDITFEIINIDSAYNLTKIHSFAFLSTNCYVKQFYLFDTPYGNITDNSNIYNALNAMINVEAIFIRKTSLTTIPSNAFTVLNKLKTLYIYENLNLKSIGINAFYELNNLTELYLTSNAIDHISDHALSFRNRNTITLNIYISFMPYITSNSFSIGVFTTIRRPFQLYLQNAKGLKYLDENIFSIVLADGNQIDLTGTPLECDCRMYWLYENKAQNQILVHNAICTDGKSVFTDRQNYIDCNV